MSLTSRTWRASRVLIRAKVPAIESQREEINSPWANRPGAGRSIARLDSEASRYMTQSVLA